MALTIPVRKIVLELRYKPDLRFYARMDEAAANIGEHFSMPDWQRSPLTVEVFDKRKHRRVFLSYRRCFFECDLTNQSPREEIDHAVKVLDRVCHGLRVGELTRLGVRQWVAADLGKSFALMVDEIATRFLGRQEQLVAILTDTMTDVAYVVDYQTADGWSYHLRLGPMTRKQWLQTIQYETRMFDQEEGENAATLEEYHETIPENLLFLDVDCYQETVRVSEMTRRVAAFRQRSHKLIDQLLEYCRG